MNVGIDFQTQVCEIVRNKQTNKKRAHDCMVLKQARVYVSRVMARDRLTSRTKYWIRLDPLRFLTLTKTNQQVGVSVRLTDGAKAGEILQSVPDYYIVRLPPRFTERNGPRKVGRGVGSDRATIHLRDLFPAFGSPDSAALTATWRRFTSRLNLMHTHERGTHDGDCQDTKFYSVNITLRQYTALANF